MTLGRIIWNNARQRGLSTLLTGLSVALGVALMVAILTVKFVSQERLRLGYSGFDLIVGAKGSPLQLVLNVVYNLDTSPGNIPYSLYEDLKKDPQVKLVVPFAMGDNYKGFRIVATTDTFLKKFEPIAGQPFQLDGGRVFHFDESELREAMREAMSRSQQGLKGSKEEEHAEHEHDHEMEEGIHHEAVLGSEAARLTGLKIGDTFVATHGVVHNEEGEQHDHLPWSIVGILQPTGTPADRAIYINLDSFYRIEGHVIEVKPGTGPEPKDGQISALALKTHGPFAMLGLQKKINQSDSAQAALPAAEIQKLLTIIGNVDRILLAQAMLVVLVSAIGTGLAMFNSMSERRKDIAVLRALGAQRSSILGIVMGEAVLISGMGGLFGLGLGHAIIHLASSAIQSAAGFIISPWEFRSFEAVVFLGVLIVGAAAGLGPAISAYRTDVSTALSP